MPLEKYYVNPRCINPKLHFLKRNIRRNSILFSGTLSSVFRGPLRRAQKLPEFDTVPETEDTRSHTLHYISSYIKAAQLNLFKWFLKMLCKNGCAFCNYQAVLLNPFAFFMGM